jgi:hypothetical protein
MFPLIRFQKLLSYRSIDRHIRSKYSENYLHREDCKNAEISTKYVLAHRNSLRGFAEHRLRTDLEINRYGYVVNTPNKIYIEWSVKMMRFE